jgi:hypothetical protein
MEARAQLWRRPRLTAHASHVILLFDPRVERYLPLRGEAGAEVSRAGAYVSTVHLHPEDGSGLPHSVDSV